MTRQAYSKVDRIADEHGVEFPELLASLRIDRNMKVMEICEHLGISKRTYQRYFPVHLVGEPRVRTQEDVDRLLYYARLAREAYSRKAASRPKKEKPKGEKDYWRRTNCKFFRSKR